MCFIQMISDPATPMFSSTTAREVAVGAEAGGDEEAKGPSSLDVIKVLKNAGIVGNVDIGQEIAQRKNTTITKEEEETKESSIPD